MKKTLFISICSLSLLFFSFQACAEEKGVKKYGASGEVTAVDSVYSRVTIQHGVVAGFAQEGTTDFVVEDKDAFKSISTRDLVDFEIEDRGGEAVITRLARTGRAAEKGSGMPIGQVAQDILEGTAQVAKTVTQPITPVGEVVGGTVDAATGATDAVIGDKRSELSEKF